MKAVIYAAGVGRRLGPQTLEAPKVLLEFGGKTLLRRHVENLTAVGVTDIIVVSGWRQETVDREIAAILEDRPVHLESVRNEFFREGSALSVWAAAGHMTIEAAPLLLMDGDVLYGPPLLERLVHSSHETCLLIDRNCELDEVDPVLVPCRNNRPFDFMKGFKGSYDTIGESIGFFKVGSRELERFLDATRDRTAGKRRQETLEDIVQQLVREGRFGMEDVTGYPWIEIDFPEDIERALKEVLPAVENPPSTGKRARAG